MSISGGFIDVQMVDPGPVGVRQVCLHSPVDVLTCWQGLGARDMEDSYILTLGSLLSAHIGWGYVQRGAEVPLGCGSDFSKSHYTVECSHEAGEDSGVGQARKIKVHAE